MELDKYSLLSRGVYIDRMTPVDKIFNLVKKLRPIKTKFPLIRVGSKNDGGYLIPDDLKGISTCFSPGVDINSSFENDLLMRKNINSHLADFSVNMNCYQFRSTTNESFSIVNHCSNMG